MSYVADSSFVLAILLDEPCVADAAPIAEREDLIISAVNFAELVGKLAERGATAAAIMAGIAALRLEIVAFTPELALAAGLLRPPTKVHGLSLGDSACLALGLQRQVPILTMDRVWRELELGVDIRVMR
jgi:PIN domain nuclease of toxin-antitoxin system